MNAEWNKMSARVSLIIFLIDFNQNIKSIILNHLKFKWIKRLNDITYCHIVWSAVMMYSKTLVQNNQRNKITLNYCWNLWRLSIFIYKWKQFILLLTIYAQVQWMHFNVWTNIIIRIFSTKVRLCWTVPICQTTIKSRYKETE